MRELPVARFHFHFHFHFRAISIENWKVGGSGWEWWLKKTLGV